MIDANGDKSLQTSPKRPRGNPRKVFVVHGRDLATRDAVFEFLDSLGLQPIEWSEALRSTGKGAPSIQEAVVAGMDLPQVIVVLLTPDEKGVPKFRYQKASDPIEERLFRGQPRLNVIFEAGRALALLPNDTLFLRRGQIRKISDIDGLFVYDVGPDNEWRGHVRQFLIDHGCAVNESATRWIRAGNFEDLIDRRLTAYKKRFGNYEELLETEELAELRDTIDRSRGEEIAFCLVSALQHKYDLEYWLNQVGEEKSAGRLLFQFMYSSPASHDLPIYRAAKAVETLNNRAKDEVKKLILDISTTVDVPPRTDEVFRSIMEGMKISDLVQRSALIPEGIRQRILEELWMFPARRQLFI